ncbi:MAG: group II intron reverse transcriptase/maturase [Cyanobacteria bacterium J06635_10]
MLKANKDEIKDWKQVNWKSVEKKVYKLQKRIYRASFRDDFIAVRRLQKTLINSFSAKLLAVRKISQDNQGKKTAGIDGIKSLSPKERLKLTKNLVIDGKSKPTRRVWIPKPGKKEKRPLGIPTMFDRAKQSLIKLALEPEWEAKMESNSYGFRPGRSVHDAIEAIFVSIKNMPKYVLDADISKCFDKIDHNKLLRKINTFPKVNKQIKSWLKSGVIDNNIFEETTSGTPQGGVISPLLANIALHGMIENITKAFPQLNKNSRETWFHKKGTQFNPPNVVRYADDFVIFHNDIRVISKCKEMVSIWLKEIGIELKPEKTSITHTKKGFNFLGFHIKQYEDKHRKQGFVTLIKPSDKAIKKHYQRLAEKINSLKTAPQKVLIANLNPIINGWCNYYSTVVSAQTFKKLDFMLWKKLMSWALSRSKKGKRKAVSKYWREKNGRKWNFSTEQGHTLRLHSNTDITRYIKVKGDKSIFDGDWKYWGSRKGSHPTVPSRITKLLKKQKGKCNHCGLTFLADDLIEVDHIIPKSQGGRDVFKNLQLLHRHCHDHKTAIDISSRTCVHDKD